LLQTLEIRRDEVQQKLWGLEYTNRQLLDDIRMGYSKLSWLGVSPDTPGRVQITRVTIVVNFILAALYGALGTCVFLLRSMFRELVDRTFDARRIGEKTVRILLGLLSGLAIQWLVAQSDGTIVGGLKSSLVAFLAGYSLEMLFTLLDRLVLTVEGQPARA